MLERARNFFTGGKDVQEARATIDRLGKHPKLSQSNQQRLEGVRKITRRHTIKLLASTLGLTAATSSATASAILLLRENGNSRAERAQEIRDKINLFEEAHAEDTSETTLQELFGMIDKLYEQTFDKKPAETKPVIIDEKQLKVWETLPDSPEGESLIPFSADRNGNPVALPIITLVILGKPELSDPNVLKISAVRAVYMHEYIHSQTKPVFERGKPTTVSGITFNSSYRRGLKWIEKDKGEEGGVGWLFEETNTQLLTEYMLDPNGQDDLYQKMSNSPLYRKSFNLSYFEGVRILKQLYAKLGISIKEVEEAHYNADPKSLLDKIDRLIAQRGIVLPEPASRTLIKFRNFKDSESEDKIREWQEMVDKI